MAADPLIAIIDDDASARNAATTLVRSLGFSTVAFSTADEFLVSDALDATACVVTDLRMPGTTGLDLHRALVAAGRRIPTILVTAFPDGVSRAMAEKAGVQAYLAKPLDPRHLLEHIRGAIVAAAPPTDDLQPGEVPCPTPSSKS